MKKIYLLLCVFVFGTSCEKDKLIEPVKEQQETHAARSVEYISFEKAPEIIDAITSHTGKSSLKISSHSKIIEYKNAYIDLNSILKVSDNKKITNYSFMIDGEGAPVNEFYNLVVNKHPLEGLKSPYVLKYIVDEDALDNFIANKRNFRYFKGKRVRISFDRFFDNLVNKSSGDCEQETPINNTGGSNGNFYDIPSSNPLQTNPSVYNYAPTVTPGSSYELYLNNYNEGTQSQTSYSAIVRDQVFPVSHLSSSGIVNYISTSYGSETNSIVGISFTTRTNSAGALTSWSMTTYYSNGGSSIREEYSSFINFISNPHERSQETISKSGDDCNDGSGEIGVMTSMAITFIEECFYPTVLGGDQISYLELGGGQAAKLRMFLQGKECSTGAKEFAILAMEGGEVDYEKHLDGYDFHAETTEILAFEQDYRDQMSQAELAIFDNLTRFQKLDYLHSAFLAREYSQIYFENFIKVQYNGNALGAAKLGETLMEQLTSAHEVPDVGKPANPLLEKSMDLHNNQVGRNIGSQSILC